MKHPAVVIVVILLLVPLILIGYRIVWLGYPLFPTVQGETWQVSMEAHIKPGEKEINMAVGLPFPSTNIKVLEERITSGTLSFNLLREEANRFGVWFGSINSEGEIISYQATVLIRARQSVKEQIPTLDPYVSAIGIEELNLAKVLVSKLGQQPAHELLHLITQAAKGNWGAYPPSEKDMSQWSTIREKHDQLTVTLMLLRAAGIPSRPVEGLLLVESVSVTPIKWIDVWTNQKWESMNPETGELYKKPTSLLPLAIGGIPAVRISLGSLSEIKWNINRQVISNWQLHFQRITQSNRLLDKWSLFNLPSEFQETFRILLLVPMGALLVCILRNLVGFSTFGVFMPLLMALAFRNTGIIYGLGIFSGVIAIGYLLRRGMNNLRLLLVPRLSVLLTIVISCLVILAMVGSKIGFREFMAVGLFPIVILTMIIERFFVLLEEAGTYEAFITAAESAAVAFISYEVIRWETLQLTFFIYPELILAVAALQILVGRYTGFRLSELFRFRELRRS